MKTDVDYTISAVEAKEGLNSGLLQRGQLPSDRSGPEDGWDDVVEEHLQPER